MMQNLTSHQVIIFSITVSLLVYCRSGNRASSIEQDPWMPLSFHTVNALTNNMFGQCHYKDELLRPTKYLAVPSPDCGRKRFLVMVFTRVDDSESRNRWRKIYSKQGMRHKFGYCVIFPVGHLGNERNYEKLNEEIRLFDDILQGDFLDSYKNLTLKTLSALRFVVVAYPEVESILKIDDDVAWNVPRVAEYEPRSPIRKPMTKWYVPYEEYPEEKFPPHCSGIAYILHKDAVLPMLQSVRRVKYFWIDDVFITGFLTKSVNILFVELNQFIELEPLRRKFPNKIFYNNMMFYGTSRDKIGQQFVKQMW